MSFSTWDAGESPRERETLVQCAMRRGIVEQGDHLNCERLTIEKEACAQYPMCNG